MRDGVVSAALELVEIAALLPLLPGLDGPDSPFSAGELAYARARRDPERRLAARLAAKRAALRLLGPGLLLRDAAVERGRGGPPWLVFSERAAQRMHELGAARVLVSLTHGRTHAAAAVLLLRAR